MSESGQRPACRFSIDAKAVAAYRVQLRKMAKGFPIAEAAVDGYSDWQVVEAMERMWAAGTAVLEPGTADEPAQAP
jgi:hypothetical protein